MTYTVGSYYDLTHLNRKVVADAPRKSFAENLQETSSRTFDEGSYIFKEGLKAFRQIPVSMA